MAAAKSSSRRTGKPSDETLAHVIDKYIELEQLTRAAEGYQAIVEALLAWALLGGRHLDTLPRDGDKRTQRVVHGSVVRKDS